MPSRGVSQPRPRKPAKKRSDGSPRSIRLRVAPPAATPAGHSSKGHDKDLPPVPPSPRQQSMASMIITHLIDNPTGPSVVGLVVLAFRVKIFAV
jgi:hypothetical protein